MCGHAWPLSVIAHEWFGPDYLRATLLGKGSMMESSSHEAVLSHRDFREPGLHKLPALQIILG